MPQALKPLCLIQFVELGELPSDNWPSGVIRMGSQYESGKVGKISKQKGLNRVQMVQFECPKHPKPPVSFFSGVGRIPLFPLLALWGNKIGLPSIKVKKFENCQNKSGSTGCKWSSLNARGTENPLSHPILRLEEFPFPIIGPLG